MARRKMAKNKTPKEIFHNDNVQQDEEDLIKKPNKGKNLPGFKLKQFLTNKGDWKKPESI